MPKYEANCKVIKREGSSSSSMTCTWRGEAASESEAMSKARKYVESSKKWELENGYVIEDLIVKPK